MREHGPCMNGSPCSELLFRALGVNNPTCGSPFSMDAKTILQNTKQPSLRRVKLLTRLGQFNNVSKHNIIGKSNNAADFLSRLDVSESESDEDGDTIIDDNGKVNADRIR